MNTVSFYRKCLTCSNVIFRDYLALNVYVALCYYKLDYYDVSQEVLAVYLQQFPDSAVAINLKACNHFRLYNGKAAEVNQHLFFHYTKVPTTSFTCSTTEGCSQACLYVLWMLIVVEEKNEWNHSFETKQLQIFMPNYRFSHKQLSILIFDC